jgi:hypothetical protein
MTDKLIWLLTLLQAQEKASGSFGGKKNAEKLPALQEETSRLEAQWQEQAPGYLNTYQQFDFARLTSIKEVCLYALSTCN